MTLPFTLFDSPLNPSMADFNVLINQLNTLFPNVSVVGDEAVSGHLTVALTTALTGNATAAGTLTVTGLTTVNGGLAGGASADIALNTNKFTVDATQGDTVIAGDLDVAGTATFAGIVAAADVSMTGVLKLDTVSQALNATIALAAGATNSIDATITMVDMAGTTVTGVHEVEVFITESNTGALGLTADSASGALTASTGVVLTALTAKKHITAVTDVNGVLVLNLVDSAKPADQYFAVKRPFGSLILSAASGADWGA